MVFVFFPWAVKWGRPSVRQQNRFGTKLAAERFARMLMRRGEFNIRVSQVPER